MRRARVVLIRARPLRDANGVFNGGVAIFHDVTGKRRMEDELRRASHELERSSDDLTRFAQIASHDLREPLRMVSSYLGLLNLRYKQNLDEDARDFIRFAVEGAARVHSLVEDLSIYSLLGTRALCREPVDCADLVRGVIKYLSFAIAETGAKVTVGPLPTVPGDAAQLSQVFRNLIANALKFRGTTPLNIDVTAQLRQGEWLFAIRDNGIGFSMEHAARIFDIFRRLHSRDQYPGTGIGLAICKRIVERHGGDIWAESTVGRGAEFRFTIPAGD